MVICEKTTWWLDFFVFGLTTTWNVFYISCLDVNFHPLNNYTMHLWTSSRGYWIFGSKIIRLSIGFILRRLFWRHFIFDWIGFWLWIGFHFLRCLEFRGILSFCSSGCLFLHHWLVMKMIMNFILMFCCSFRAVLDLSRNRWWRW